MTATTLKSVGRKAAAALSIVTTMLTGLVFMANPASAHHPELSATAECADDYGQILVSYDAYSWLTDEGSDDSRFQISRNDVPGARTYNHDGNPDTPKIQYSGYVTVDYTPNGGSTTILPDPATPSGHREHYFETVGGVQSGSFLVEDDPSLFPLVVHTEDHGFWKNGADGTGATGSAKASVVVDYPYDGCQPPPAEPGANVEWDCGDPNIIVTLTNDGGQDVDITVNGTTYTVGAGDTEEALVPAPGEDETVEVVVQVDGQDLITPVTYDGDCQTPAAVIDWECGSAVTVTLTNAGGESAVDFDVNGTTHTVGPDGTEVVDLGVPAEGSAIDVTVTAPGMDPVSLTEDEVDCEDPAASSSWECGADGITVTLDNSGSQVPVDYVVNGGTPVTVGAGEIVDVTIPGPAEDGDPVTVTVTVDGEDVHTGDDTYEADCFDPEASSAWDCGLDITVTLDNTSSELPVEFVVNGGDPVTVDAGETLDVTLPAPVEDGAAVPVSVTVDGEEILADSHGPANCVENEQETCEDDENAVDSDDDGTNDACEPICDDDVDPSDTDGDGVGDTCPEVLDNTTVFPTSQPASAAAANSLAFTGSGTLAMATGALALLLLGFGLTLAGKELSEA